MDKARDLENRRISCRPMLNIDVLKTRLIALKKQLVNYPMFSEHEQAEKFGFYRHVHFSRSDTGAHLAPSFARR